MIVEIKGTKIDVDLREATQIETLKVGDSIKVLAKRYDDYKVCPGIVIGFVQFQTLPTIEIAYLDTSYSEAELHIVGYNSNCKNLEIAKADVTHLSFKKGDVLSIMDKKINGKELELQDLQAKKDYFLKNFGRYFAESLSEATNEVNATQRQY